MRNENGVKPPQTANIYILLSPQPGQRCTRRATRSPRKMLFQNFPSPHKITIEHLAHAPRPQVDRFVVPGGRERCCCNLLIAAGAVSVIAAVAVAVAVGDGSGVVRHGVGVGLHHSLCHEVYL